MKDTLIYIVDDKPIFSSSLKIMLESELKCEVKEFNSVTQVMPVLENDKLPSLIVMDIQMPEINGIEATRMINIQYPQIRILALSMFSSELVISNVLEAGAVSFISKSEQIEELLNSIKQVINNGFYYSPNVLRIINDNVLRSNKKSLSLFEENYLSKREIETLIQICLQKKNKEIGETLSISERTVEGHRANLLLKTDSSTSLGLIVYALKHGIVDLELLEVRGN